MSPSPSAPATGVPVPASAGPPSGPPPVPPRALEPALAWPPSPVWPDAPADPRAQSAAVRDGTPTVAQQRWLAAHGDQHAAAALIPSATMDTGVFQLLTHRDERALLAIVPQHFPLPRDRWDTVVAPGVGVAGLQYYIAHAPIANALLGFADLLEDPRLDRATTEAIEARLARDLVPHAAGRPGDALRRHTAQTVLRALAAHATLPMARLPAIAALALAAALHPVVQRDDDPAWGAWAAFDRLRRGVEQGRPDAVGLAPEALAPLLAVAPAAWRAILLTEVLPALRPAAGEPLAGRWARRVR